MIVFIKGSLASLAHLDTPEQGRVVVVVKGRKATEQDVADDAKAPHVDLNVVGLRL